MTDESESDESVSDKWASAWWIGFGGQFTDADESESLSESDESE